MRPDTISSSIVWFVDKIIINMSYTGHIGPPFILHPSDWVTAIFVSLNIVLGPLGNVINRDQPSVNNCPRCYCWVHWESGGEHCTGERGSHPFGGGGGPWLFRWGTKRKSTELCNSKFGLVWGDDGRGQTDRINKFDFEDSSHQTWAVVGRVGMSSEAETL